jgi:outer membrane protein assembly factor BamB
MKLDPNARRALIPAVTVAIVIAFGPAAISQDWPQFRGPNGAGVSAGQHKLPAEFGPEKNVLWKTPLPRGLSSPCIWGDRIFLTALDGDRKRLVTVCVDRTDGKILWRRDAPATEFENVHRVSSPATATPVTDGERLYVYFGSCGLLCYDVDGQQQWTVPMPAARNRNGSGTSPVLMGDLLLVNREDGGESYLLAVERRTGKTAWKRRDGGLSPMFGGAGSATPVIWNDQVILHQGGAVQARRIADGEVVWSVKIATTGCSTPVVGEGKVFVSAWNNFGEPDLRAALPSFPELLKEHDRNQDKLISKEELPASLVATHRPDVGEDVGGNIPVTMLFDQFDITKDGQINQFEWLAMGKLLQSMTSLMEHGLIAIRLGGEGDVTETHVAWKESKNVAEIPSPLFFDGKVYMIKNGGVLACFDAKSGKLHYRKRLGAAGPYYASLVYGDGKIFAASGDGKITIFEPGNTLVVLAESDLGEPIMATPAIVDGRIYVRTDGHLFAFGLR